MYLRVQGPSHLSGRDQFISASVSVSSLVVTPLVARLEPNSTWLKKHGNLLAPLVDLVGIYWFQVQFDPASCGPSFWHFLALFSIVLASWAVPGTCHLPYGNSSRRSAFSPTAPSKVLLHLSSSCWATDPTPNQSLGPKERDVLMARQAYVLCLCLELGIESSGWGWSTGEETPRRRAKRAKNK